MKKNIVLLLLAGIFILNAKSLDAQSVSVSGRQIYNNETPYYIKGICYNPVPMGSDIRNFDNLSEDLALMLEAGINTIRVYSPIDDVAVLDQINEAGIKVIIGFGYNQDGNYDILSGTFINYINKFKNHAAILLWELGNEYNYHPEWFNDNIETWYNVLNNSASVIHSIDPLHPVTTAHGELPDSLALRLCPNIDVWGMNVYRWDNPDKIFTEWEAVCSKPMYLSEAGADSYMTISRGKYKKGVNEKAQSDAVSNILKSVFRHSEVCSGLALFSFSDELWKAGNNSTLDPGGWAPNSSGVPYDGTANEEYWGIVDVDRNKKKSFEIVKTAFLKSHN